jgi:hypothetical protein
MLVCPTCRTENVEGSGYCTTCGRSLEPVEGGELLRASRPSGEGALIDIPNPKPVNALPGILALVGILLAGTALGAWYLLRPDPCDGKYSSQQFPYCLEVPQGWEGTQQTIQGTRADAFAPQAQLTVVLVTAGQTQPGVNSQSYAEAQRDALEADGLFPSPTETQEVDGSDAVAWEMTTTDVDGTVLRERRVTLVRDGQAWIILMVAPQDRYPQALDRFRSMLETWSWT